MKRKLNILIACEESQACCRVFREMGHNAFSCDLFDCSGTFFGTEESDPRPYWHFNHDVTTVLDKTNLTLQDNTQAVIDGPWDLMIGHPPCTYLAVSGARWMYDPADKDKPIEDRRPHPRFKDRRQQQKDGAAFFRFLADADVKRIAIENPVGVMSSLWRKPDQSVQPYMFGDPYSKNTCLWLKGLHCLHPSKETADHGERIYFESGKSQPKWYSDGMTKTKSAQERQKWRSKTFPNVARAIAEQWVIQTLFEENLLEEEELEIIGEDYMMLLESVVGGVLYTDSKVDPDKEALNKKRKLNRENLALLEEREQMLIKYWQQNKK